MTCPATLREFDTSVPDPGDRNLPPSINGEILDRLLRHRHYLLMAENGVIRDAVEPLREAVDEIEETLARLVEGDAVSDFSALRRQRLGILRRRLNQTIRAAEASTREAIDAGLLRLSGREVEFQHNMLRDTVPSGIELDLVGPDTERLRGIIESPLGGRLYSERLRENFGALTADMSRSLTTSVALGEGIDEAQRRLRRKVTDLGINRATLIARSEIQRVASQTAESVYRRNQDVLKGSQWIATLDERTCMICAPRDGQVYPVGEGPMPVTDSHPGCRCFRSPVTRSFEELGIDAGEFQPSTRASMDGQVAATTTYPEWFADQPESFQRDVLGPGRFRKFKDGNLELSSMAKSQRVLPLDELPERDQGL